jgi:tRNA (mo5U34)-methyltransferase
VNGLDQQHPLVDPPRSKPDRFAALPADLASKSVLDVGGKHAFEMKQRGAARVVAIDSDPRQLEQARLAHRDIEWHQLDIYRVDELREKFDFVICMGVLHHLRHPLLALDRLYDHVVGDKLLVQSMLCEDTASLGHPAMQFIEHQYAGDWTNWWIPNRACVEAMLRSAGFLIDTRGDDDIYVCRRGPCRAVECDAEGGG